MIRNIKCLLISWYWKLKNNDCPKNYFSASNKGYDTWVVRKRHADWSVESYSAVIYVYPKPLLIVLKRKVFFS